MLLVLLVMNTGAATRFLLVFFPILLAKRNNICAQCALCASNEHIVLLMRFPSIFEYSNERMVSLSLCISSFIFTDSFFFDCYFRFEIESEKNVSKFLIRRL